MLNSTFIHVTDSIVTYKLIKKSSNQQTSIRLCLHLIKFIATITFHYTVVIYLLNISMRMNEIKKAKLYTHI